MRGETPGPQPAVFEFADSRAGTAGKTAAYRVGPLTRSSNRCLADEQSGTSVTTAHPYERPQQPPLAPRTLRLVSTRPPREGQSLSYVDDVVDDVIDDVAGDGLEDFVVSITDWRSAFV